MVGPSDPRLDDQGRQFAERNLKNVGGSDEARQSAAPASRTSLDVRGAAEAFVRKIFSTLGENIATSAAGRTRSARPQPAKGPDKVYYAEGFSEEPSLIASAQAWGTKDARETLRRRTTDVHSPPRFRVYGATSPTADFAKRFLRGGTPMARRTVRGLGANARGARSLARRAQGLSRSRVFR